MTSDPQDLNSLIESALRVLGRAGYDTAVIAREHAERMKNVERGDPSPEDFRYALPQVPPKTEEHFIDGRPQDLAVSVMWPGFSYSLTPGQRAVLRDTYGMTPSQTGTVAWVEKWEGTVHARSFKLTADVHVDPRRRTHVLSSVVIRKVGEFFKSAAERDDELRKERRFGVSPSALELGRLFDLETEERWAVEDLTGVKVQRRVEITGIGPETFVVCCEKTGNVAKVPREKFFATVAEYEKAYAELRRRASTEKFGQAFEDVMKDLGL